MIYIKSLKVECNEVITEPMHSKEEKFSAFIGAWLIKLWIELITQVHGANNINQVKESITLIKRMKQIM